MTMMRCPRRRILAPTGQEAVRLVQVRVVGIKWVLCEYPDTSSSIVRFAHRVQRVALARASNALANENN